MKDTRGVSAIAECLVAEWLESFLMPRSENRLNVGPHFCRIRTESTYLDSQHQGRRHFGPFGSGLLEQAAAFLLAPL